MQADVGVIEPWKVHTVRAEVAGLTTRKDGSWWSSFTLYMCGCMEQHALTTCVIMAGSNFHHSADDKEWLAREALCARRPNVVHCVRGQNNNSGYPPLSVLTLMRGHTTPSVRIPPQSVSQIPGSQIPPSGHAVWLAHGPLCPAGQYGQLRLLRRLFHLNVSPVEACRCALDEQTCCCRWRWQRPPGCVLWPVFALSTGGVDAEGSGREVEGNAATQVHR